jgi:hypothetical protein
MLMISGCSSLDKQLKTAATQTGTAQARVTLPAYPEDCRAKEAHAALVVGSEVRSVLKRERLALDRQNSRTDRCAGFYDNLSKTIQ